MKNESRRQFLKTLGTVVGSEAVLSALPPGFKSEARSENDLSSSHPNILLLLPDQHRFDWIGATPEIPVRTPNLDALAQRGIRFTRAFCPSPLCAPSRACLASGKEYDRCRVPSNKVDYPLDQTTFYTLLRDSAYHVAGCGKFDLHKASPIWGVDGTHLIHEWGFSDGIDNAGKWDAINSGTKKPKDPYMAYLHEHESADVHVRDFEKRRKAHYKATFPTSLPEEAYCDNWVAENGLQLMNTFPADKPWFLQVNFTGPHPPMDITKRMDKICRDRDFPQPNRNTKFDPETHNAIRQNYSAMVENIDRWVGIYVAELEKRGELANTLIVYSSDHGEMLGDHNMWAKKKPYQPSVGVPMIIAGAGVYRGVVSDAPVSLMDLHATFLEYANISQPADTESRSLKPLLEGKTKGHREYVLSGLGSWRMVFDGRYKLVTGYGKSGQPLLFDLQSDPLENTNIAKKADGVVHRLSEILK